MLKPLTPAVLKWLGLALAVIVVDHFTKWWVTSTLDYQQAISILPFFSLVLVNNTGAAFSFLANAGGWQRWVFIALALVLGGALGNVLDRIVLGHVVDFLYFHYRGFGWPAFNVADSAITVGAVLLIWDSLRGKSAASNKAS